MPSSALELGQSVPGARHSSEASHRYIFAIPTPDLARPALQRDPYRYLHRLLFASLNISFFPISTRSVMYDRQISALEIRIIVMS